MPTTDIFTASPLREQRAGGVLHLYCLPYAGGSARVFNAWQQLFHPEIRIVSIDYPGRGTRIHEPLLDQVSQIADEIADTIAAERHARYALFGHSMGSIVAFETCHRLACLGGSQPELLVVSGHRGPNLPRRSPLMHAVSDERFIAYLGELGATPPDVIATDELMELFLPILRADFRACETYEPNPDRKLRVPMAVYGGLSDADVDGGALRGWQHETTGPCVVRLFPGGHFFIRDHAAIVTATLQRDLREMSAGSHGTGDSNRRH
ncbi:thioesterase II family protein [Bradyrhizobium oligotrophicum]|nr:alpha/beta fold hydrolase [Bradyrhizobium oligotrophicum]